MAKSSGGGRRRASGTGTKAAGSGAAPAAKKSKAAPRGVAVSGDRFRTFLAEVGNSRQKVDDANMAHAAKWKTTEALGIHAAAAKDIFRLDKMSDEKRNDHLRAFDAYRAYMTDWTAQADMIDEAERLAAAKPKEPEDRPPPGVGEAAAETVQTKPAEPPPNTEKVLADQEKEEDEPDDTAAEMTPENAAGGYIHEAGRKARFDGHPIDRNPHDAGSVSHRLWAQGWGTGDRQMQESAAVAAERAAAEQPPKLDEPEPVAGRRATVADASAAVH